MCPAVVELRQTLCPVIDFATLTECQLKQKISFLIALMSSSKTNKSVDDTNTIVTSRWRYCRGHDLAGDTGLVLCIQIMGYQAI